MKDHINIQLDRVIELLEALPRQIALEHAKMMDDHCIKHAEQVLKEIEELFSNLPNKIEEKEEIL